MSRRERARKAVLLVAASNADKNGIRGRLHVLLHGPPGTGKTALRDWCKHAIPGAQGIGSKSSEAGLKGDASGGEFTPGALTLAHGSMLCIEELDKFAKSERDALYEAMSEGAFEVNQGEIRETYPAEVRTVATCNDTSKFRDAIVDRFDFVVEMDDYNADETVEVTETLYNNFEKAFIEGEPVKDKKVVPEYLQWVETFEPGATDGAMDKIRKMTNYLIQSEGHVGNIRGKTGWLRGAYAVAKLNRRDLTPDDFITAVELMENSDDIRRPLEAIRDDDIERLYG